MTEDTLPDIGNVSTEIIDGLRIRLSRSGRAHGVPVLFTSPWPESIYSFHRILPHFTEDYALIAIDLPGFGHSDSRSDVMSPRAMGAFLVKLVAHLKLERIYGVGPDVGALAFLFAAAENPRLFKRLAVGGAAMRVDLAAGRLKDLIASPKGAFAAVDGADAVSSYLTQAAQTTLTAIIEDFRLASAGQRFENAVQFVRAYNDDLPLLESQLSQIRTPVLVIAGKNDPIVPAANAQFLADRLPRNRLCLLDAGHRVWDEAAEGYSRQIASWFGGEYRLAKAGER